jgi:arylsulfatase A-like enzyme/tetratricopeptide (TPR) repeat protein
MPDGNLPRVPKQRAESRKQKYGASLFLLSAFCFLLCSRRVEHTPTEVSKPSILLVTLDTTRVDAIGPDQHNVDTPSFTALSARGRRYRYAYATVPQTLASHSSMLTGLYPAGHGIHENGRYLAESNPLLAQQLKAAGYHTAAFVSAFAVAKRFGLARGFDVYDDDFGAAAERTAKDTTDRAVEYLKTAEGPQFVWVHYYDPHFPYVPPEPFRTKYSTQPYFGEVTFMDEQLGRLVQSFDQIRGDRALIVVADHGEGLGDHGEAQHGNLLYQSTMHVPLVVAGPGMSAGVSDEAVSTRRVYHTILDWAGLDAAHSLRSADREVVIGEAMKPFLDFGWQPQVMAVDGRQKTILAGRIEAYDVVADPAETRDLGDSATVSRGARAALKDYPVPSPEAAQASPNATDEERRKLASLGYVSAGTKPIVRPDAPRPADMAALFPILDEAAAFFVREQYAKAIPLLQQILTKDPHNLDSALRLATSYSSLGRDAEARASFERAMSIAPNSQDVRTYLGLHYARGKNWQQAVPLLEGVVAESPDRVPALEGLASIRERQGRIADAVRLREKIFAMRDPSAAELLKLAEMQMALGQTEPALRSFESLRAMQGGAFRNDLELGVLYLAANRLSDAKTALDRVPPGSPAYAMALFKRAQVAVLLREPDAQARIASAREHADANTRALIERERLFR